MHRDEPTASECDCFDECLVEELGSSAVDARTMAAAERHLASCPGCRRKVEEAAQNLRLLKSLQSELPEHVAALRAMARPAGDGTNAALRVPGFRLVRLIGEGGSAQVYEAVQLEPRRTVAIRLLRSDAANLREQDRFRRGAELLASMPHPTLPQVYMVGSTEAGVPYMAMEHVQGEALDLVARGVDRRTVLRLLGQVAAALSHCHGCGIAHGDIKPSNILVTADGDVKLVDFGLARSDADAGSSLTSSIRGTPGYMSPERFDGAPVEPAGDLFAFGVIAHELLAGSHPYLADGAGWVAAAKASASGTRRPIGSAVPDLEARLARLFDRLLDPDPVQRPAASVLVAALRIEPASRRAMPQATRRWAAVASLAVLAIVIVSLQPGRPLGSLETPATTANGAEPVAAPLALAADVIVESAAELPALVTRLRSEYEASGRIPRVGAQLAMALEAVGELDEAAVLLEQELPTGDRRVRRGQIISTIRLARVRVGQGQLPEAERLLGTLGTPSHDDTRDRMGGVDSEFLSTRAMLRAATGQIPEARRDAESALAEARATARAQVGRADPERSWFLFHRIRQAYEAIHARSGEAADREAAAAAAILP